MSPVPNVRADLSRLAMLLMLGAMVGLACWPLNLIDRIQDSLLARMAAFHGAGWTAAGLGIAVAPVAVLPLLLVLMQGELRSGAGSGIPQTSLSLDAPQRAPALLGRAATASRLLLWTLASLAVFPMGREGPVVQLGASVAHGLRRRFPSLLPDLADHQLVAIGAGAGLAGGFNSPLMGLVFVLEELTRRDQRALLWPGALACLSAALISNLGGVGLFTLGMVEALVPELLQLFWALPLGIGGGLLGGLLARGLVSSTRWLKPRVAESPILWGLVLGGGLAVLALITGGWSCGDGEALMHRLLQGLPPQPVPGSPIGILGWLMVVAARLLGPVLALSAGVPGGLIDPAFALGAVFGSGVMDLLGGGGELGMALGMAAGLAGATQLPMTSLVLAMRMAGDAQWLWGLMLSAVLGAYVGRRLLARPVYQALTEISAAPPS